MLTHDRLERLTTVWLYHFKNLILWHTTLFQFCLRPDIDFLLFGETCYCLMYLLQGLHPVDAPSTCLHMSISVRQHTFYCFTLCVCWSLFWAVRIVQIFSLIITHLTHVGTSRSSFIGPLHTIIGIYFPDELSVQFFRFWFCNHIVCCISLERVIFSQDKWCKHRLFGATMQWCGLQNEECIKSGLCCLIHKEGDLAYCSSIVNPITFSGYIKSEQISNDWHQE